MILLSDGQDLKLLLVHGADEAWTARHEKAKADGTTFEPGDWFPLEELLPHMNDIKMGTPYPFVPTYAFGSDILTPCMEHRDGMIRLKGEFLASAMRKVGL